MKTCNTCKWSTRSFAMPWWFALKCGHETQLSKVNGKPVSPCWMVRELPISGCTESGIYWEAK